MARRRRRYLVKFLIPLGNSEREKQLNSNLTNAIINIKNMRIKTIS